MGGVEYALKKLRRWKGQGPTERNRKMAQFLIKHGSLSSGWSHALSEHSALLIDLALEWGDFAMWEEVLKKSTKEGHAPQLGLNELIRAWDIFMFDRIKNMLVHSLPCLISPAYVSLQSGKGYPQPTEHKGRDRLDKGLPGPCFRAGSKCEDMVETTGHRGALVNQVATVRIRCSNVCQYCRIRRVAFLLANVRTSRRME